LTVVEDVIDEQKSLPAAPSENCKKHAGCPCILKTKQNLKLYVQEVTK